MPKLFGTDGIRGLANEYPVTVDMGLALGKAMAIYLKNRPFLITGRDTRISSPMLELAIMSGIMACGGDVLSIGIAPTPALAYIIRRLGADGGVMVSASHNPYQYNGFKPFIKGGEKLTEEQEEQLESIINEVRQADEIGNLRSIKDNPLDYYKEFLLGTVPKWLSFNDIKIVLDCANGATFKVAPSVFSELGVKLHVICSDPDGRNINDRCGALYPGLLKEEVLKRNADLGLAFDGDGDRLVAVDEKGNILSGDQLIGIFAKFLKKTELLKKAVVITTVMSNLGLKKALEDMGIAHIMTKVGDRNVIKEMKIHGAILGGEESGHIIFLNHHTTGDGILSALQLLCAIKILDTPLSELADIVKMFPQVKVNVSIKEKKDLSEIPEIRNTIEAVEKELSGKGRILVRYSGTEPVCRIMVEGEDKEMISKYAQMIASVIEEKLGVS